jgi:outer membrane protein assembly factor BamA
MPSSGRRGAGRPVAMGIRRCALAAAVCAAAVLHTFAPSVLALQMEQLDTRDWHVVSVDVEGNQAFSDYTLRAEILTHSRPWYTLWQPRPIFDPGTLEQDLLRLRRFYEARGYFDAKVLYDIEASDLGAGDFLAITFWIEEGEPSTVGSVDVGVHGPENLVLPESLSVKTGDRFDEEAYQKADADLKEFFLEKGYAHVEVKREADVDAAAHRVRVHYTLTPGPETYFGDVHVEGADGVGSDIVLEDLEWKRGERFSIAKIKESREQLLKTHLFQSVRIGWDSNGQPIEVPILVQVGEKDYREAKLGVGYATDEKYRVQARWDNWNFFGGGRQMSLALK